MEHFSCRTTYIPRCTHIKTNGTQCGSPALRGRRFCFFHKNWQAQRVQLNAQPAAPLSFTMPVLEDAESVQVALMQIMRLLVAGQLDAKIAGLLLYALQTASANLRQMKLQPYKLEKIVIDPRTVGDNGLGDDAWSEDEFEEEEEDDEEDAENDEEEDEDDEAESVARAACPEPVEGACPELVEGPVSLESPSPAANPADVARVALRSVAPRIERLARTRPLPPAVKQQSRPNKDDEGDSDELARHLLQQFDFLPRPEKTGPGDKSPG